MSMSGVGKSCKGCTERYLGCHDCCEDYQATKRDYEAKKILKKKANEFYEYTMEKINKDKRRRKNGK